MMRPPPESPAQRWVTAAEQQLAARKLTTPKGDNAYDSVLAALGADAAHGRMGAARRRAWSPHSATRWRCACAAATKTRAREYLQRATTLAERTAPLGTAALAGIHEKAAEALRQRVEADEKSLDRKDALAAAALANEFAGDQALAGKLRARAGKIAQVAQSGTPDAPAPPVMRGSDVATRRCARDARPSTRASPAATNRASALCREKHVGAAHRQAARLARTRDSRRPKRNRGLRVVGRRRGLRTMVQPQQRPAYRLPSSSEVAGDPAQQQNQRPRTSPSGCASAVVAGTSWRGARSRTIDPDRGYDDVGFRLVREL